MNPKAIYTFEVKRTRTVEHVGIVKVVASTVSEAIAKASAREPARWRKKSDHSTLQHEIQDTPF